MSTETLPDRWMKVRLEELGVTYSGLSGKNKGDFGIGKPYIPYMNVYSSSRINIEELEYVNIDDNEIQNRVRFGDVLFTTSSETPDEVGMSSVLLNDIGEVYLNSFCFGFRMHDFTKLLPGYARYLFRGEGVRKVLTILAQGSTRFNLSKNTFLRKLELKLPQLPEQQKIADILSTVDEKIAVIDKQIAQTGKLKKGLMQRLLTKGIGHTRFKDSPLGRIPEGWGVVKLIEFASKITDGSHFSPVPLSESQYLIGTVKDMRDKDFNLETCAKISEYDYNSLVKGGCKPEQGDVLFSKDGTIGKTFVFDGKQDVVLLSSVAIIRLRREKIVPDFACQVLKSPIFYNQLEGLKSGSAIRRLVLKAIKEIKVPVPPLNEQQQIAEILSTVDDKLQVLHDKKQQHQELKKGLMQQLLTGKLRVNHLLQTAVPA